jgi:hypothetical protein
MTDKRLIVIDIQGLTGTKIEIKSVPYSQIVGFSITTAGILDLNAELHRTIGEIPGTTGLRAINP